MLSLKATSPILFGSFNAEKLDFASYKKKVTFVPDGNYLTLRIKRNGNFLNFTWQVRFNYRKTFTDGHVTRGLKYYCLGDLHELTQSKARELTKTCVEFVKKNKRLPVVKRNLIYTAVSVDGSQSYKFCDFMNFNHTTNDLSEDEINGLHAYNMRSKSYRVSPMLNVLVTELKTTTERVYCYSLADYGSVSYSIRIGRVDKITLSTAKRIVDYINSKLAVNNSNLSRKTICQMAIQDFFRIQLKERSSHKNVIDTIENYAYPVYSVKKKIYITDEAVGPIFDKYNSLVHNGMSDALKNCKFSECSWKVVLESWYAMWSKSVGQEYHKYIYKLINKYTSFLYEYDVQSIVEQHLLNHVVLSLNAINPNIARKLLNALCQVMDYAVALDFLTSNSLPSLKTVVRKLPTVPVKSLDPYNLKNEIYLFFKDYVSKMNTKYQIIIELLFYTLLRTSELLKTRKDHLFLSTDDSSMGRLKTVLNKTLNEFSIPLTTYAQKLFKLYQDRDNTDSVYIFPKCTNTELPISNRMVNFALSSTECHMLSLHGIRSVGASFFAEHTDRIPYEVGMACLQHKYSSRVHLIYDRTFLYKPRMQAMQIWSDFLQAAIGEYSVLFKF